MLDDCEEAQAPTAQDGPSPERAMDGDTLGETVHGGTARAFPEKQAHSASALM